jgi:uncharacterized membrane protein
MTSLYDDGKLDKNDIGSLDTLGDDITDDYARGKITKEQFDKLVNDISISYREIFKKEIASIKIDPSKEEIEKEMNEIKNRIEDAYAKEKIDNEQYTNLKNETSVLYEEMYRKRLDSLKGSFGEDSNQEVVMERLQEDIRNAYSKGKLSELHFNLLKEKIAKMTST